MKYKKSKILSWDEVGELVDDPDEDAIVFATYKELNPADRHHSQKGVFHVVSAADGTLDLISAEGCFPKAQDDGAFCEIGPGLPSEEAIYTGPDGEEIAIYRAVPK